MATKVMRSILVLNLVTFLWIFVASGSPMPRFGNGIIENILSDWWILSTPVVGTIFMLRVIDRMRHKGSAKIWLDSALFGAWLCAFIVILIAAIAGFAGF